MLPRRLSLLLGALALCAGCSQSDEPVITAPPSASASPTASASATPPAGPTATPRVAPTTAAATPALPTCRGSALTVTDADTLVTPTTRTEVFVIRTSSRPCQLDGYPAVRLLGTDGKPLQITVRHGGAGLPPERPKAVWLSRDTSLSFDVATSRDGGCQDATAIVATLPGTTTAHRATTDLRVCGGTVGLSPVHRRGEAD